MASNEPPSTSGMIHGANTFTEWSRIHDTLNGHSLTESLRERVRGPRPEMIPMPEPTMSEPDIALIRGQLLLKLLDIENSRCNAKSDEDDRTDSLALVLEGDDHIIHRIQSGMAKYMALLGIEEDYEDHTPPRSIDEMQRNSIFNHTMPAGVERRVVQMTQSQADLWEGIGRAFRHLNMPMDRVSLMDADLNRGGSRSPEDQVTMTFRVLR